MSDLTIAQWLESAGRTAASLAADVDISRGHLSHIMAGRLRPSAELAVRIERATNGAVPRARLRPDLFELPNGEAA